MTLVGVVTRLTIYRLKDHSCQRYFLLSPWLRRPKESTENFVQWVPAATARNVRLIFIVLTLSTNSSLQSSATLMWPSCMDIETFDSVVPHFFSLPSKKALFLCHSLFLSIYLSRPCCNLRHCVCVFSAATLTFRHSASCILGQELHYSPENAFYIFNQQIYFIIWYLLDRASLI